MLDKDNEKNEEVESEIVIESEVESKSTFKAPDIKKLKKELAECKLERQEYLDGWQRSKADFINARKEDEKRSKDIKKYVSEGVMSQFIPALDSFDMAFSNKEAWESVDENWRAGIEHIYSQILNIFKDNGIEKIEAEGKDFDPSLHESIEQVEVDDQKSDGVVLEVVQNGYSLGDSVIRASRVKVGLHKK